MATQQQYRSSYYAQANQDQPRRKQRTRSSDGTVSTTMSSASGRESAATHVTEPPTYSKKIVVVGDGGCGKTCLLISYSQGYFPEVRRDYDINSAARAQIFENYITYPVHPPSGKTVELALWDTAGQEEYDRLRPLSYPETDLIFWYPEVLHFCPYTPLILVGLKSDLRYKRTCIDMLKTQGLTPVTSEQGMAVARKMDAQYMECSSKEMLGVDEIFDRAILTIVANDRRNVESAGAAAQAANADGKPLPPLKAKKKKRKCQFL
ncbi:Small GTPase superfamily, Rho type [Cordyceps fumosorosea ARSEF 2679]|uniref:Small GTPase superfamily, Rho type n=1 Tax=Cordyceps fumosorosea (strain ARSEF 2679) TaxID=1081104 RepID=A0A167S652_CORFA|nr:Small GTPase superfamily, Rho type [Cordyceps fumosorosea ARSEF 2679]OAA59298.1 Small GTPase superfamily, Rho type [Cordyceps fumosorosea ARSEF 2679]